MFARPLAKKKRVRFHRRRQERASGLQEAQQIEQAYTRDQAQVELPDHLSVVHGGCDDIHRYILDGEFLVVCQGGGHC